MPRRWRRMPIRARAGFPAGIVASLAVLASGAFAGTWEAPAAFSSPALASDARLGEVPISLSLAAVAPAVPPLEARHSERPPRAARRVANPAVLNPYRAQMLLRSVTLPGWGQATVGRRTSATVFGIAEVGVWATYTAFRVQERMRRDNYERTARLLAGIDLRKRDEEYRRIVGSFLSSDEYNQFVVYRDAANLYYNDPVQYNRYIDEHKLGGANSWAWPDVESLLRYRGQRKDAQRAALRANTALAAAIVNRLLSAVHAARVSAQPAPSHAWRLEVVPTDDGDVTALRVGVRRRF